MKFAILAFLYIWRESELSKSQANFFRISYEQEKTHIVNINRFSSHNLFLMKNND